LTFGTAPAWGSYEHPYGYRTAGAIRRLRKDGGTTIASVAALAFAIGAAVATGSLVSAVLLKPLPVAEAERLFQVGAFPPPNVATQWVSTRGYPVLQSVRDSGALDNVAAGGLQRRTVLVAGQVAITLVLVTRAARRAVRAQRNCCAEPRPTVL
jgi:hypothetical protein